MDLRAKIAGLLGGRGARSVVLGLASVALLALVILVSSALSEPKPASSPMSVSATSSVPGEDAQDASASARYEEAAERALASGDTTEAVRLLELAVTANPENESASRLLTELRVTTVGGGQVASAATPGPSGGAPAQEPGGKTDGVTPGGAPDSYDKPVEDVTSLLPSNVWGYTRASLERGETESILALRPASGGSAAGRVALAVLTAYDRGSPDAARSFVDGIKKAFPEDGASVTIGGFPGKFGTDGARLASATFSRGRFAFEVVLTAEMGVDPVVLKGAAVEAASAFPAAKK